MNEKPLISILAPVRGRPTLVQSMVDSALRTAYDPTHVEIILRVDWDDHAMLDWVRVENWIGPVVCGHHGRGYADLASFINQAARLSRADTMIVVNDDAEFVTPGWDQKLAVHAMRFSDGIFDIGVDTKLNAGNFPFPCVSRRLFELLGVVYDERLVYTDIWLRDVLARFERAVRVDDVVIKHNWQGRTADQDEAASVVHGNTAYARLYDLCVSEAQERIQKVLS